MLKIDEKVLVAAVIAFSFSLLLGSNQNSAMAISAADQMVVREHINKGNYYLGRRMFDKAIDEYEEAQGIDSESQEAKDNIVLVHNNWGILLFQQGKWPEARKHFERALQLNPTYKSAKSNLQVMKSHLQKIGLDPNEAMRGSDDPMKPPPSQPSAVMILTPGIKSTPPSQTQAPGAFPPPETPFAPTSVTATPPTTSTASTRTNTNSSTTNTQSNSGILPTGSMFTPKRQTYGSGTIMFRPSSPSTTGGATDSSQTGSTSSTPPASTVSPSASSTSVAPPASTTSSVVVTPSESMGQTIDEKLAAIENKVYGRKLGDIPVMRRLEKLETDTIGTVGTGTVYQRVEILRRHYGI